MGFIMEPTKRILSIQSHVVSGYCGNKSATFPLQLLGFEVDVVNTVQLSNHTQYATTRGQIFSGKDLKELHEGLLANDLLKHYDSILSGYVADVGYIEAMASLISEIKTKRTEAGKEAFYTFDPVLGDDGTNFYVPNGEKIAEAYKRHLMPLADIITPNRFEASILSGIDIGNLSEKQALGDAIKAIESLHQLGPKVVIITSFEIASEPNHLSCILSHRLPAESQGDTSAGESFNGVWLIRIPKLDRQFTGTGDLFAALVTGWLHKTRFDVKRALENTANSIHEILEDTLIYSEKLGDSSSCYTYELRLIQNKEKILSPGRRFTTDKLDTSLFIENNQ